MRRALGELDQNTPIANRRSSRQCSARARDETPVRTRDAADGQGGTPTSLRRLNTAALDAAEVLVRKNRLDHHSRNLENHLTYAEALRQSGYQGDNGVVVLSKKMSAARVRGAMNLVADALISMSQTQGKEVTRIEEEGVDS